MPLTRAGSARSPKAWQVRNTTQLLAVALAVLPLYAGGILSHVRRDNALTVQGFTLYLAVIAPLSIVVAWLVLRFVCGESPRSLNLRPGKALTDLGATLALSLVILVANVVSHAVLSGLLPESSVSSGVRELLAAVTANPLLFVLFAGPLIFLGAASEELVRVFLLGRLWRVWPSTVGKLVAVAASACLFGLLHLYQGPVGVGWTMVYGLIAALYYLRFGRVAPLVFAHYLTNALQVVVFALLGR